MKVRVLSNCLVFGQHYQAGTVVEVATNIGKELIGCGRGTEFSGAAVTAAEPVVETRDPEIETPKKRGRPRNA